MREEGWSSYPHWRWWIETRNVAKHPTIAQDGPSDKEFPSLKLSSVEVEKSAYTFL